jgi:predicted nucleic acid-binding protein
MLAYIDSNIFLYAVLYDDERAARCRKVLSDIVDGKLEAVTSVLTWDEFSHVVEKVLDRPSALIQGERFLHFPRLLFQPCTTDVLIRAQQVRASTHLGARDSIHAASSLIAGARTLISEDRDFDGIPELSRRSAE